MGNALSAFVARRVAAALALVAVAVLTSSSAPTASGDARGVLPEINADVNAPSTGSEATGGDK